ncbi:MAG: hypothetical protein U0670_07155 [Anaerolineae bacterium]
MRWIKFGLLAALLCGAFSTAAAPSAQNGCLPTQFEGNGMENAIVTPGQANNVRAEPSTSGALIGQIAAGSVMNISYEDPVCAGGYLWRRVAAPGLIGWTAEASATSYFIVPFENPEPVLAQGAQTVNVLPVSTNGVSFTVPAEAGFDSVMVGGQVGVFDPDMMGGIPSWLHFTLSGPDLNVSGPASGGKGGTTSTSTRANEGHIDVWPYHDTELSYSYWQRGGAELEALLNTPTDLMQAAQEPRGLTGVPVIGAGAVFYGQPAYVPFGNGNGLRYLTVFAQNYVVFSADTPYIYFYRGITADGHYLISAELPISIPAAAIPPAIDPFGGSGDVYTPYVNQFTALINAEPETAFTPDLSAYDALMASFTIEDERALAESIP